MHSSSYWAREGNNKLDVQIVPKKAQRMPLPIQHYAGNSLNRSVGDRKNEIFLLNTLKIGGTQVVIVKTDGKIKTVLCKKDNEDVYELMKYSPSDVLDMCNCNTVEDLLVHFVVVLLGYDEKNASWNVSIDFSNHIEVKLPQYNAPHQALVFESGRSILTKLQKPDLAIAGQALAISGWHEVNMYCGKSGLPTAPIECGMKRGVIDVAQQLSSSRLSKLYPRIDPVAIAAVISPDKSMILLGNMKSYPPQFFSCLSGFVEPCESVEEAVRREVWEESGVPIDVDQVSILGTQPWPIGRGGVCEIMIGCLAYATDTTITIHDSEVNEVRWFTRDEARAMVEAAEVRTESLHSGACSPYIPGSYAIAFHLVKAFLNTSETSESTSRSENIPDVSSATRSVQIYCWLFPFAMFTLSLLHKDYK